MIWKNLAKKMNIRRRKIGTIEQKWENFGKQMAFLAKNLQQFANTEEPKGKVGQLYTVWTRDREFGTKWKKWTFRKFGQGPFYSAHGFIKGLEKRGYKILGEGAFATVLAKGDSDRVIKVIRRPDGWINYIQWATENGEAGKFAPKVFSYKKIKGRRKDFAVAVMERLSYTLDDAPLEHQQKLLPGLIYRASDNAMARKFTDMLAPGLMDFLVKMASHYEIPINNFDLHPGNMMLRVDGSFVIVDPVSRPRGEEIIRLRAGVFTPAVALNVLREFIESSNRYRSQWAC